MSSPISTGAQAHPKPPVTSRPKPVQKDVSDGHPRPGDGHPRPGDGHPRPGDGHPRPGDGHPRPGDGHPRPGDGKPRPGDGKPRPGDGKPRPGDGKPRPGDGHPRPGDGHSRPGKGHPRPARPGEANPRPVFFFQPQAPHRQIKHINKSAMGLGTRDQDNMQLLLCVLSQPQEGVPRPTEALRLTGRAPQRAPVSVRLILPVQTSPLQGHVGLPPTNVQTGHVPTSPNHLSTTQRARPPPPPSGVHRKVICSLPLGMQEETSPPTKWHLLGSPYHAHPSPLLQGSRTSSPGRTAFPSWGVGMVQRQYWSVCRDWQRRMITTG